jgi:hypothetical protein
MLKTLAQTVSGLKDAFFAAMQNGYAKGAVEKTTIQELPCSKVITYRHGIYVVRDVYQVTTNSDASFGTTVISVEDNPLWMMQYQGHYRKGDIPFLKRALMKAYAENRFVGGRGPESYAEDKLAYRNNLGSESDNFTHFRGREEIWEVDTAECVGWHEYQGMLLGL